MPFVISDPVEEEEKVKQPGFVLSDAAEDSSFSVARDVIGPLKEFVMGGLETGIGAFGGAPGTDAGIDQDFGDIQRQAQELLAQGVPVEELAQHIAQPEERGTLGDILDQVTGGQLLPQTERQRLTQASAKEAGSFVAAEGLFPGASGLKQLAKWGAIGGLFGLGEQVSEESGGTGAGKIATGLTFAAVPFLLKKGAKGLKNMIEFGRGLLESKKPLEGVPKFLTEAVTPKSLADIEISAKDLTGRVAKTSEEMLGNFEQSLEKVAEPRFKDVGTFRAADIESSIVKENQKAILDSISPIGDTKKASWEGLQSFVNENFEAVKESYTKMYDVVEQSAKNVKVVPKNTFEAASKIYKDLQRSIIKAPEEGGVKKALQEVLTQLKPLTHGNVNAIPLDSLLAGKRSINRLLRKSDVIPGPVDLLKPVSRAMKLDTLAALESRPAVKRAFEAAEDTFKKAQEVFHNDAMLKMKKTPNPEELSSFFTKPSNLQKLNTALGENRQIKDFADRLIVENIASKSTEAAREMARETREFLGSKARKGLDDILEYGDKLTSKGQQSLTRGKVLEDLQRSFDVGEKPAYTLKVMQNPVGYDLVKSTLNRSPKGKKMWKSLQRQTFEDLIASSLDKNKQLDFEKAKDILDNPHMKTMIQEGLGDKGMKFFKQLENYGENMAKNVRAFAIKDKPFFEKFSEKYLGTGAKYALYALAGPTKGLTLLPFLGREVMKKARLKSLHKILEKPEGQQIIKEMGQPNLSTQRISNLLKRFALVIKKQEEKEE